MLAIRVLYEHLFSNLSFSFFQQKFIIHKFLQPLFYSYSTIWLVILKIVSNDLIPKCLIWGNKNNYRLSVVMLGSGVS